MIAIILITTTFLLINSIAYVTIWLGRWPGEGGVPFMGWAFYSISCRGSLVGQILEAYTGRHVEKSIGTVGSNFRSEASVGGSKCKKDWLRSRH